MDKQSIEFKKTSWGYKIFEGELLSGGLRALKCDHYSLNLKKGNKELQLNKLSINEAYQAIIKFHK